MGETNEIENIPNQTFEVCSDCKQHKWCQKSNSKRIDEFIQNAQLKARNHLEVIEWIPYHHLKNVQYLNEGGFAKIYKAILLDGFIYKWDKINQQWKRYSNKSPLNEKEKYGYNVVLKSLNNSSDEVDDLLNEVNNLIMV